MGTPKVGAAFIKYITDTITNSTGFAKQIEEVKINSVSDGECTGEFIVSQEHLNHLGGLHGGFTNTLVDLMTTYALMSKPTHPGTSVTLNVDYKKGVKVGDEVRVCATLIQCGRKLAFLECELRHNKDNKLIAKGSHTKFGDFEVFE